MNKKYILLGILGASALAVYSINRRFSANNKGLGKQTESSGENVIQKVGNAIKSVVTGKKILPTPKGGLVKEQPCPNGYTLIALDPTKPKEKTCIPTPKQDTRVPIKCPSWMVAKDGICVNKTSDDGLSGGGFSGNPPKQQDENQQGNQTGEVYTTLTFDENSANRY